jgi:hypothetical protein
MKKQVAPTGRSKPGQGRLELVGTANTLGAQGLPLLQLGNVLAGNAVPALLQWTRSVECRIGKLLPVP